MAKSDICNFFTLGQSVKTQC